MFDRIEYDRKRAKTEKRKQQRKVWDANYRAKPEVKAYRKQWHLDNKERANRKNLEWYYANRESEIKKRVISNRKRQYGVTPEMLQEMIEDQDGKCAICKTDKPGGKGDWHIDHNHQTNKVRGLLCQKCNQGLGLFNDSPRLLESALDYLNQN